MLWNSKKRGTIRLEEQEWIDRIKGRGGSG
jgi:hypothetical protein